MCWCWRRGNYDMTTQQEKNVFKCKNLQTLELPHHPLPPPLPTTPPTTGTTPPTTPSPPQHHPSQHHPSPPTPPTNPTTTCSRQPVHANTRREPCRSVCDSECMITSSPRSCVVCFVYLPEDRPRPWNFLLIVAKSLKCPWNLVESSPIGSSTISLGGLLHCDHCEQCSMPSAELCLTIHTSRETWSCAKNLRAILFLQTIANRVKSRVNGFRCWMHECVGKMRKTISRFSQHFPELNGRHHIFKLLKVSVINFTRLLRLKSRISAVFCKIKMLSCSARKCKSV